jgi:hypothetical protein
MYQEKTMALRAVQKRGTRLTELQQKYLDIVIERHGGVLPHGVRAGIARELGCSRGTLYALDGGSSEVWTREYKRRLQDVIPLLNPIAQARALQKMFDSATSSRELQGKALTSKDPVDVLAEMRKLTQGPRGDQVIHQNTQVNTATFNFGDISDEELTKVVQSLTKLLRSDGLEESGDIIEGAVKSIIAENFAGRPPGTAEENSAQGEEMPPDP